MKNRNDWIGYVNFGVASGLTAGNGVVGYAASASAGDSPSTNTSYATTTGGFYELHLSVTPSTGGVDNTFSIPYNLTTGIPTQSYFIVEEYNSGFSYASNNLGTSDAPILVQIANTSTVVVP